MFSYPMIDMAGTGRRIRSKMEQAGFSVKDVKDALGLSHQSIYCWFEGKAVPSIDSLFALSTFLGVPMEELIVSFPPATKH